MMFELVATLSFSVVWYLLVDLLRIPGLENRFGTAVKCAAAIGISLAASSCLYFIWLMVVGSADDDLIFLEIAVLLCLGGLAVWRRHKDKPRPLSIVASGVTSWRKYLWIAFTILAVADAVWVGKVFKEIPHGGWDAFGIWNHRARLLNRTQEDWKAAFSTASHADYPLLLPACIANFWLMRGDESTNSPIFVAACFGVLTVAMLVFALNLLRGGGQGWIAGCILLCS